jgi:hypothetical protein
VTTTLRNLDDAARLDAERPDIDERRFESERCLGGANLAPMIGPVGIGRPI